ncbi:MAG: MarR family transcriptional regulator [Pseudomonadota bacterium]|nr:MarR family transcriptional regulator [Pseudomonadota bacterium]
MNDGTAFLVSDVSRLLRRRFDERARAIGVTRPQWRALTALSRHEGINQGGLADLLEVEPITLCRMVDRLAEAGHVERRRDPTDRRAWKIYLTDRSRPLLDQLKAIGEDVFAIAFAGFDTPERTALATALGQMRDNLSQTDAAAADPPAVDPITAQTIVVDKDHTAHG